METYCEMRYELDEMKAKERAATSDWEKTRHFALQELDKGMRDAGMENCHFDFNNRTMYVVSRYKRRTLPLTEATLDLVIDRLGDHATKAEEGITESVAEELQKSLVAVHRHGVRLLSRRPAQPFQSDNLPDALLKDAHTAADSSAKIAKLRADLRDARKEKLDKLRKELDVVECKLDTAKTPIEVRGSARTFRLRKEEHNTETKSHYTVKKVQNMARRVTSAYLRREGLDDADAQMSWQKLKTDLKCAAREELATPPPRVTTSKSRIVYHVVE